MIYMTAAQAYTVDRAAGIFITVNTALTGTITIADAGVTVAVITNPTVGGNYRYYGFKGAITATPSTTCDVTLSVLSRTMS